MDDFMDDGDVKPAQRSPSVSSSSSAPKAASDDGRAAWPGPGVPWQSGPVENNSKRDSNRGRNTLMAAADDDLQKMVDDRNDARYRRDYDGADAIREELRTIYRVEIYDKVRKVARDRSYV
jgi:hypothetical protein